MFEKYTAILVFSDGTVMYGYGLGKPATVVGEVCFNTAVTGYQEILTDPSYAGQIITFTFPHIGNTGINSEDNESLSKSSYSRGLIVRESITNPSNFRSEGSLQDWLIKHSITGISGIDTRAVTSKIRKEGFTNAVICYFETKDNMPDIEDLKNLALNTPSLANKELASEVSSGEDFLWENKKKDFERIYSGYENKTSAEFKNISSEGQRKFKVVVIDYGVKVNILKCLEEYGCELTVVPANTSADDIKKYNPEGIFLSNGPGDPKATSYAIDVVKELLKLKIPIFGICLGHQILSLAMGCQTEKMHNGHRGSNHPVKNLITGDIEISSHNHGFTVVQDTVPEDIEITHISLFDKTVEGLRSKSGPFFSVQYHPEASPGTHDSLKLFESFIDLLKNKKEQVLYA